MSTEILSLISVICLLLSLLGIPFYFSQLEENRKLKNTFKLEKLRVYEKMYNDGNLSYVELVDLLNKLK
jgi:hypothetical protein